jgi:hypothetical protein
MKVIVNRLSTFSFHPIYKEKVTCIMHNILYSTSQCETVRTKYMGKEPLFMTTLFNLTRKYCKLIYNLLSPKFCYHFKWWKFYQFFSRLSDFGLSHLKCTVVTSVTGNYNEKCPNVLTLRFSFSVLVRLMIPFFHVSRNTSQ